MAPLAASVVAIPTTRRLISETWIKQAAHSGLTGGHQLALRQRWAGFRACAGLQGPSALSGAQLVSAAGAIVLLCSSRRKRLGRGRAALHADTDWATDIRKRGRVFLDTADTAEWERLLPLGIFYGVTTNPTLLRRAGLPCTMESAQDLVRIASDLGAQEVMLQAWAGDEADGAEAMAMRGAELSRLACGRVVVKLPATDMGIRAATLLRQAKTDVKLCMTTGYAAKQGFVAAALGADYIAPYLGRMQDLGLDAFEECRAMKAVCGGHCRVLVASIRSVDQMVTLGRSGFDTFTIAPTIADELISDEASKTAAEVFERDARESNAT